MTYKEWVKENCGYELFTTFFEDFTIAEAWGVAGIKETYNRAFKEWKNDYKYITEMALILSHKSILLYEVNDVFSQLYAKLYHKLNDWAQENLKGAKAKYYFDVLD